MKINTGKRIDQDTDTDQHYPCTKIHPILMEYQYQHGSSGGNGIQARQYVPALDRI
ncbi:hypothetical protein QFZ51_004290 [Chitinophaga sp. W3I9]